MNVNVFAVRENDQRVSGIILCGLSEVHIQDILNVFRVKSARRNSKGIFHQVSSLVSPVRTKRSHSSSVLLVGNPHASDRDGTSFHKLSLKPGDDLVTGPNGFYISVDAKDEECVRGLAVLGEGLAQQPVSERLALRTGEAVARPLKRKHSLSERVWALRDSVLETGQAQFEARQYLKLVAQERREYVRRLWALRRVKIHNFVWRLIRSKAERHSCITAIVKEFNGAPALQLKVEQVPRFVPRPVQRSVRVLSQKLGQVLLPA